MGSFPDTLIDLYITISRSSFSSLMNSILFLELSTSSFRLQTYSTQNQLNAFGIICMMIPKKRFAKHDVARAHDACGKFRVILARSVKKHGVRIKSPKNRPNQIK